MGWATSGRRETVKPRPPRSINNSSQRDVKTENKIVVSLKEYITRHDLARRKSRTTKPPKSRRPLREDVGDVSIARSPGLDAASVALPAGIDLEDRAARMNAFWDALVDLQYRDVIVVAMCVGDER
jgi:hypothetical protein